MIGYNFRMPEVCAAMGLAQLEKIDVLIKKRIEIAGLYMEAIKGCDWLIPQKVSNNVTHSFWAFTLRIDAERTKVSWKKFRKYFMQNGGKSFYGAWSLSYLEPSLLGMKFPDINLEYGEGLCPIAESIQPNLIQLKTNFETISIAKEQSLALLKTINDLSVN